VKLLHLDSSIQADASASRAVSKAIVQRLLSEWPDTEVNYRDLAASPLDHLTLALLAGREAAETLDEFLAADTIVIGAALYNFTIPSQLKAWIDRVLIAGKTFRYGANGPEGLAGGKRVVVALARGGLYGEGSPFAHFEHAETLLRGAFAFIGIPDAEFIVAEGLNLGEESRRAAIDAALGQAARLAPGQLVA